MWKQILYQGDSNLVCCFLIFAGFKIAFSSGFIKNHFQNRWAFFRQKYKANIDGSPIKNILLGSLPVIFYFLWLQSTLNWRPVTGKSSRPAQTIAVQKFIQRIGSCVDTKCSLRKMWQLKSIFWHRLPSYSLVLPKCPSVKLKALSSWFCPLVSFAGCQVFCLPFVTLSFNSCAQLSYL